MKVRFELDLPEELRELFESEEQATRAAREALVLDLLQRGKISQGKAAELLELDRWELLALMTEHGLTPFPQTPDELLSDLETLRKTSRG